MNRDKINLRIELEDEEFSRMAAKLRSSVTGKKNAVNYDRAARVKSALDRILVHLGLEPREIPKEITDLNEQIDYVCSPYGIMYRTVRLDKGWYRHSAGNMLALTKDDIPVAITSGRTGIYSFIDPETGNKKYLNRKNAQLFQEDAVLFYRPFPQKEMNLSDLIKFLMGCLSPGSLLRIVAASAAVTLVGMILPGVTKLLFSSAIKSGSVTFLAALFGVYVSATLTNILLNTAKGLVTERVNTELQVFVEAAAMARLLSLPAPFFRNYSSGELKERLNYVTRLADLLVSTVLTTWLTSVFSLVYFGQVFRYAGGLVVPALLVTLCTVLFTSLSSFLSIKYTLRRMELESKESGLVYAMISGMQKIKLSGSEKRAFSRWMDIYSDVARLTYSPPLFMLLNSSISLGISLFGTLVMYFFAIKTNVDVADYYAFTAAYGNISGAFTALAGIAMTFADIRPTWDMAKPILKAKPETAHKGKVIKNLEGNIELSSVTFRYAEGRPNIFENFSLKINQGEYLAIVGKTGCGKSTLVRLLLGFEKPNNGTIYYDGNDMGTLFLPSLRKNIGCVTQNGKLFQGDIYSNIVVSAPWLTFEEAMEAAETAGIADDINAMPMGLFTVISEGAGGISGGQKQRLMIARAIAPKPKILIFDEATSALDNITQKKVSDALDKLNCTRIVIAHRLSTIKNCSRIIVIDGGKIVEDGNYEELIGKNGYFAELVRRQRVEE